MHDVGMTCVDISTEEYTVGQATSVNYCRMPGADNSRFAKSIKLGVTVRSECAIFG